MLSTLIPRWENKVQWYPKVILERCRLSLKDAAMRIIQNAAGSMDLASKTENMFSLIDTTLMDLSLKLEL